MNFDDVLDQVHDWIGQEITLVIWLNEFGPADGWLIDAAGPVERVEEPIPEVDQPVHYVRFRGGHGFALERTWFRSARWREVAGERSLDIDVGAVTLSLRPPTE